MYRRPGCCAIEEGGGGGGRQQQQQILLVRKPYWYRVWYQCNKNEKECMQSSKELLQ